LGGLTTPNGKIRKGKKGKARKKPLVLGPYPWLNLLLELRNLEVGSAPLNWKGELRREGTLGFLNFPFPTLGPKMEIIRFGNGRINLSGSKRKALNGKKLG